MSYSAFPRVVFIVLIVSVHGDGLRILGSLKCLAVGVTIEISVDIVEFDVCPPYRVQHQIVAVIWCQYSDWVLVLLD